MSPTRSKTATTTPRAFQDEPHTAQESCNKPHQAPKMTPTGPKKHTGGNKSLQEASHKLPKGPKTVKFTESDERVASDFQKWTFRLTRFFFENCEDVPRGMGPRRLPAPQRLRNIADFCEDVSCESPTFASQLSSGGPNMSLGVAHPGCAGQRPLIMTMLQDNIQLWNQNAGFDARQFIEPTMVEQP